MVRTNSAFFVEIAKNLSFLFADNIRSFIFGMIESMPRSRPVIIATYRMLEHYAITFLEEYLEQFYAEWNAKK